jgi:cytochrome c553
MIRRNVALLFTAALLAVSTGHIATAADPAAGKAIVDQQCKTCHGTDGRSTAPGIPDLAGQRESYLLAALNEYRHGQRIHAALRQMAEQLTPADEQNVAAYFASLAPAPAAKGPAFTPYDHGRDLAKVCVECHGPDGNSITPGVPSLSGQQPGYFVNAIREYLTGARETSPMHKLIRDLKTEDLESLALYFASQTPTPRTAPAMGDAAAGEQLTGLCGGCHGQRGVSTDSATPSLAGQDPTYLAYAIKQYQAGREHPAMQRAVSVVVKSDKDAQDLAAFYASQTRDRVEHGQTLVQDIAAKCDRCHGPGIDNPGMPIPHIRAQDKDYLMMTLRSYREGRRESSVMHNMTLPYGDAVVDGVASYYATQAPTK